MIIIDTNKTEPREMQTIAGVEIEAVHFQKQYDTFINIICQEI